MNHVLKDTPIDREKNLETYGNPIKEKLINFMKDELRK